MKQFIPIFLLCLLTYSATAQNASITGKVTDEQSKPVPYATVMLRSQADSILYKGEVSNEEGEFILQNIKKGSYYLQVQYTGYAMFTLPDIHVENDSAAIPLNSLQLQQYSKELNTVIIAAEKPFIEKQADKTVVNIENSIIQSGSTVMEVFEKLPGVVVDQDGNIRLRGKQGVIVAIDGKPTPMSGQDLSNMFKGMSAANIQKIEIITNPSAKWDASGNSGIINIIMKKNKQLGYNGSANVTYGQGRYAKYNTSVNFNYKKNKLNFFLNYSYANRKGFNNLILTRRFYDKDTLRTTFETNNYIIYPFSTHTPRVGLDYYATKKTTVSFLASGVSNHFNPTTVNHTDILGEGNEKLSSFDFSQRSRDRYYNYDLNTQINHSFDTLGQNLVINLDHFKLWNNTNQTFTTLYTDVINNSLNNIYLTGKQIGSLYLYSAKVDYSKPFGHDITFEAGAKSSLVDSDKDMQFYNVANQAETFDTTRSSHFLYKENINAVYVNLNKKFKKLTLQTGLRGEQTNAQGLQKLSGQTFTRNYFQVFPTAYIDYNFNDKNNLNINLGRRIDRPAYEQMNPFKRLIDFTTYSEGNPYLLPQLTYNTEMSYSHKNTYFVTLNYSITYNNITDVLIQNSATKTTIQSVVNLDRLYYYSIDLTYSKRLTKWWKTNTNVLSYFAQFNGTVNNYHIDQGRPSFFVSSTNNFSISENLSAELSVRYNHQNLYGVTLDRTTYNVSAGFQKSILKKQGTITVNLTDIFWKSYPRGLTQFGNVNEDWASRRDTRILNIGFTYKFGKGTNGRMRRSTGADDEKNRIQ